MSEFEFNCMTTANHIRSIGSRRHYLSVYAAHQRQDRRKDAKQRRQVRQEKITRIALNICLGATAAIGTLAAIGFLTTVVR
jgi:hypothetical protein